MVMVLTEVPAPPQTTAGVLFASRDEDIKQRGMVEIEPRDLFEPTIDASCKRGSVRNESDCENSLFKLYIEVNTGAHNMVTK